MFHPHFLILTSNDQKSKELTSSLANPNLIDYNLQNIAFTCCQSNEIKY